MSSASMWSKQAAKILAATFATVPGMQAFGQGDGDWAIRTDIQGLASAYSGATDRDALSNAGAFVRADYLERGGFTLGYNASSLEFAQGASADVAQDDIFVSGRRHFTPDWAPGRVTLRLDGHRISSDDSDDVDVIAPQLSYLNYAKTFSWEFGFARSTYGTNQTAEGSREVDQLTPAVGFGFAEQRDWLQLRAYVIRAETTQTTQDQGQGQGQGQGQAASQTTEETAALEFKWTHWPVDGFLGIDNFRFAALFGERRLPVDHDAGSVYSLADLQTGGASIGGEWLVGERNRILVLTGTERYETQANANTYRIGFLYLNFTRHWK